ncbi:DNA-directed RNA polymerase II core subunit rpo21, partial [Linderina pennispora]
MAYNFQFAYSSAPLRTVKYVQFGIISPEEMKSMAVAKIEHPELRDEDGKPKIGGLLDPRMGTIDRNFKCQTCGENMTECPGHFGYIELAKPVYHIGFISKVKKILECVCWRCSKLKADTSDPVFQAALKIPDANKRMKRVWDICKSRTICELSGEETATGENMAAKLNGMPMSEEDRARQTVNDMLGEARKHTHGGCGHRQPTYRKEGLKLFATYKPGANDEGTPEGKHVLSVTAVLQVLKRISDEDS